MGEPENNWYFGFMNDSNYDVIIKAVDSFIICYSFSISTKQEPPKNN